MKKQIITNIIVIALVFLIICMTWYSSIVVSGSSNNNYTKDDLINLINETQSIKDNAHTMATSARALGWEDNDKLIKNLQKKWRNADEQQKEYQILLEKIVADELAITQREEEKWLVKATEYPSATKIWRYMKSLGWNDYVCAGIMGNLMAEVGGQTLNINYTSSSNGYYGMCQWNKGYSQIWGANLEEQCDFLRDTIKYQFDTYGFNYQKGFNFNSFLNMNDAQQAALAFAKSYERCAPGSYNISQQNALKAYNYLTNN